MNKVLYHIKETVNRFIFILLTTITRGFEIRRVSRCNAEFSNLLKSTGIFKVQDSELKLYQHLRDIESRYDKGDYLSVVAEKTIIFKELYSSYQLDPRYFPPKLAPIWCGPVGHESLIGALLLGVKYDLISPGIRQVVSPSTKQQSHFFSHLRDKIDIKFSTYPDLDLSKFPSQIPIYEDIQLWKTINGFEDLYQILDKVFKLYSDDQETLYFKFSEADKDHYYKKLVELGLPRNSWFVVLHVKETITGSGIRSASIKNFQKASEYVISQGGWIIQVGFENSTKISLTKNYINLTGSTIDHCNLHQFVLSEAKFFLATLSGLVTAAALYKTPTLVTNSISLGRSTLSYPNTRYLPKSLINIKSNYKLTLNDILNSKASQGDLNEKELLENDLYLEENTENEIHKATIDFTNRLLGGTSQDKIASELVAKALAIRSRFKLTTAGDFSESYLLNNPKWLDL